MIIDFHTHVFPDRIAPAAVEKLQAASHTLPFTDATVGQLAASMKEAGVDYSVTLPVATSPRQVPRINDGAEQALARRKETGVIPFGCMHPDAENWEAEMERIARMGLPGIKVHPPYQGADIDDPRFVRILKKGGELHLIVVTHAGLDVGLPGNRHATPEKIRRARDKAPDAALVLAHMGGWRCWEEAEKLLAGTGVYLDTSFSLGSMTPNGDGFYRSEKELAMLDDAGFIHLVHAFGAHHVLFGTDSPWRGQRASLQAIRALPLTMEEKDAILGLNAAQLFMLNSCDS